MAKKSFQKIFSNKSAHIVIAIFVFFFILFIAENTTLSPQGQRVLAIAATMAYLWISEAIPIAATALLPLALFPLLGIMKSASVAQNYGNHLIFLYLGGFLIAIAMQKWNLHRRIALNIVLLVGLEARRIVLGFMFATAFLSMWISNTATVMMMFPIVIAVVFELLNIKKKEDLRDSDAGSGFAIALMLGVAYASSIGGVSTLVGTPPNVIFTGFVQTLYPETGGLSFAAWIFMVLPFSILMILITWMVLTRGFFAKSFCALDAQDKESESIVRELKKMGKFSFEEKRVAIVFVTTALLWIFRKSIVFGDFAIPGWAQLFSENHQAMLHDTTVAMIMGTLLFFLPSSTKGEALISWKEVEREVPWGVLLLFGGGFALAAGISETGLAQWIAEFLVAFKNLPVFILILMTCFAITFLTEITSNAATATVILPILGPAAVGMGLHPYMLMVPAAISASCAFMLPVATPPNAIVYSSGWIQMKHMASVGIVLNLIGVFMVTLLSYFGIERMLIHE